MSKKSYQRKDHYYHKAKQEGFRSRAAYKLMELNEKFRLLRPGMHVVDLGCAPGSWLQVISQEVGPSGFVVGLDTEEFSLPSLRNATFIRGDVREEMTVQRLFAELGRKVDLIVSDMSPHLSGIKFQDQYRSYELAEQAFKLSQKILRENGQLVFKIFPGEELEPFKNRLRQNFPQIKTYVPESTRKSSTEMYLIARGFQPTNGQ